MGRLDDKLQPWRVYSAFAGRILSPADVALALEIPPLHEHRMRALERVLAQMERGGWLTSDTDEEGCVRYAATNCVQLALPEGLVQLLERAVVALERAARRELEEEPTA